MNDTLKEKATQAILYLERMASGTLPVSDTSVEIDSDLNSTEIVRSLYYIRDVIHLLVDESESKPKQPKKARSAFPLECLADYTYESDKSIMTFVAQIKALAGNPDVKGVSTKRITDWLKENGYLKDTVDSVTGNKITIITEAGGGAGLYSEIRTTRFGQEYEVIMYSEEAQKWIVRTLPVILTGMA